MDDPLLKPEAYLGPGPYQTSTITCFLRKQLTAKSLLLTVFAKKLHHRCLKVF